MRTTTSPACRKTGLHPDPRDEATPPLKGGEVKVVSKILKYSTIKTSFPF